MENGLRVLTLYIAFLIEAEQAAGVSLRELGARWGFTHVWLVILRKHGRGLSAEAQDRLANRLAGGSLDELRRRAEVWRAENPTWLPRGQEARAAPRRADFAWWAAEAARFVAVHPALAWAVAAAGAEPAGTEPREDRRAAYVERAVAEIDDLPEAAQAELRARYTTRRIH